MLKKTNQPLRRSMKRIFNSIFQHVGDTNVVNILRRIYAAYHAMPVVVVVVTSEGG